MSVTMEGSLFSSTWRSPNRAECNSSTSCGGGHRILLVNGPLPRAPGRRWNHSKRQSEPWAPTGGLTWQHSIQLHAACKYPCHLLDKTGHRGKMREFISESPRKWKKGKRKHRKTVESGVDFILKNWTRLHSRSSLFLHLLALQVKV